MWLWSIIVVCTIAAINGNLKAQELQLNQVLERHRKAANADTLAKISHMGAWAINKLPDRLDTVIIYASRPNYFLQYVIRNGVSYEGIGFDGTRAFNMYTDSLGRFHTRLLDSLATLQLSESACFTTDLLEIENKPITLSYLGSQTIQGEPYYGIRSIHPSGTINEYYIDPKTWLVAWKLNVYNRAGVSIREWTHNTSYHKLNGILMPNEQVNYMVDPQDQTKLVLDVRIYYVALFFTARDSSFYKVRHD
jgi:hypothetical protein